jgi:conjugal transfer pilus assembly protein TraB
MGKIQIPIYSRLPHRQRQKVNLVAGGVAGLGLALAVSGMIGSPSGPAAPRRELPKARPLETIPGSQLDAKDEWIGTAGKEVAKMKDDNKQTREELAALRDELRLLREQSSRERSGPGSAARAADLLAPAASSPAGSTDAARAAGSSAFPAAGATAGGAGVGGPASFPSQRGLKGQPPAPNRYPPGAPNGTPVADQAPQVAPTAPPLLKVSLSPSAPAQTEGASPPASPGEKGRGPARTVSNFLPISWTRAVLLGGVMAPTGGQAQSNPVPVLFRLKDYAMLPNGFRSQVKDCLAVGSAHGQLSDERAYVRMDLLSCVMRDGRVLEVPLMGQAFDTDGMNGLAGRVISKQDVILRNALLAGIASGIGSGLSASAQQNSVSALGSVTSTPNDIKSIAKEGFGMGVGKALDRIAQYLISLAEKTMPVIEVQPGRYVDIVITKGTTLDVPVAAVGPSETQSAPARSTEPDGDRRALLRTAVDGDEE